MLPDNMLYEAERAVLIQRYPVRFLDGASAVAYWESMQTTVWFRNRWPAVIKRGVVVRESRHQHGWADLTANTIHLPPWALSDLTLLHEVAHFCAARELRHQHHGPLFRSAHHGLIGRFMSREAAYTYRHSCLAYGLPFDVG